MKPVFAVIIASFVLGEAITPLLLLGMIAILGGIRLAQEA